MQMESSLADLLPSKWADLIPNHEELLNRIENALGEQPTNPARELIFNAFSLAPSQVKVIIIGQDPYPQSMNAHGFAFSVPKDVKKLPASLSNIFKEYQTDLGLPAPLSGELNVWRDQGVLLLNTILTCAPGVSLSHAKIGWEEFTTALLTHLVKPTTVGILWGEKAKNFETLFSPEMTILSPHPSPLSAYRGFFGSRPFTRTNTALESVGVAPIDWTLPSDR